MLIAFLPVNIYAAVNRVGMGGHEWGPIYLLIRVPLQFILIGWIWWFAVRGRSRSKLLPLRLAAASRSPVQPI